MKVYYKVSGGFTGKSRIASVDTDSLSPEEAQALRALVVKGDLIQQGFDIEHYTLRVEEGGRVSEMGFDYPGPEPLRPLLRWLDERAQWEKAGD